jgi:hypothetical protein
MTMKSRSFQSPNELTTFVNDASNNVVASKFTIVHNTGSNTFTLFWWT